MENFFGGVCWQLAANSEWFDIWLVYRYSSIYVASDVSISLFALRFVSCADYLMIGAMHTYSAIGVTYRWRNHLW